MLRHLRRLFKQMKGDKPAPVSGVDFEPFCMHCGSGRYTAKRNPFTHQTRYRCLQCGSYYSFRRQGPRHGIVIMKERRKKPRPVVKYSESIKQKKP